MGQRLGIGLALCTAMLWGTLPIAGKVAIAEMGPFFISGFRFVVAAGVLALVMRWLRPEALSIVKKPPLLVLPVAGALAANYVVYLFGLDLTTATAAQIMAQMASVFLLGWGVLYFKEELTPKRAVGALAAFAGVFLTTWNGAPLSEILGSGYFLGNLIVIFAVFVWSFYGTGQKILNRDHSSYQVLLMVYIACAVILIGPALMQLPGIGPAAGPVGGPETGAVPGVAAWLALGYLAFNTLGAYGAFGEALKHADASLVAIVVTTTPVFTIVSVHLVNTFLPDLIAPEPLTLFIAVGAALVVGGVSLVASERPDTVPDEGVPS